jgi:hypothetical protein
MRLGGRRRRLGRAVGHRSFGTSIALTRLTLNPGYVTHGTDRTLWTLRLPVLTEEEQNVARRWLDVVDEESRKLLSGGWSRNKDDVLVLKEDRSIGWMKDGEWEKYDKIAKSIAA